MNPILVATDFSAIADNAVKYAVELAKIMNTSITLFHVFHIPVMASDSPLVLPISINELEKDSLDLLKNLRTDIINTTTNLQVDIETQGGFANDEIIKMSKRSTYELIVMGIMGRGKSSPLFGSTATSVAVNATTPVLIIPLETSFKKPEKIVFAFDFQEIKEPRHMNILLTLAKFFDAKVHVLNIVEKIRKEHIEQTLAGMQVDDILYNTRHTISTQTNEDTIQGIEDYLKKNESELLVMIKRRHGFFDWLLHNSHTRKMAFHTSIPLLILHD